MITISKTMEPTQQTIRKGGRLAGEARGVAKFIRVLSGLRSLQKATIKIPLDMASDVLCNGTGYYSLGCESR
jgi:hypothetical protein